jgi:hypothetical protein
MSSDHPSSIILPIIKVKEKSNFCNEYISSDIYSFIIGILIENFPSLENLIDYEGFID